MARRKKPRIMLTLRMSESDRDRLDDLAERLALTRSDVCRMALRSGIDAIEKATKGKRSAAGMLSALLEDEDGGKK